MKGTHISKKAQRKITGHDNNIYCMSINELLKEIEFWDSMTKDRYAIRRVTKAKEQLLYLTR